MGYEVGITSLGDPDTIAPAVQKGNKELLDFINKDIKKLGEENFFHKDYEKTLHPTYGDAANAKVSKNLKDGALIGEKLSH